MIEIINSPTAAPHLAAIDFDGTMSLIRIGWQQVMHGVMQAALLPHYPDSARLDSEIYTYIAHSTGQPSIIQMAWVDEQVILYGGPTRGAQAYLDLFSHAMRDRIDQKIASIHDDASADALMVPGAREFLQLLAYNNVRIALVSGTEHIHLLRESAALRIDHFFDAGIHGPGPHNPGFTKGDAMAALIDTYQVAPARFLSVGDGPVEIMAGKSLAGYSLAVASHEASGGLDDDKRRHLIAAGADAVVANLRDIHAFNTLLFSEE